MSISIGDFAFTVAASLTALTEMELTICPGSMSRDRTMRRDCGDLCTPGLC
jgi:hypothetical protein